MAEEAVPSSPPQQHQVEEGGAALSHTKSFHDRLRALRPKPVPMEETFQLNPLEKLIRYHVIPCKMLLNAAIWILLVVYIFAYHAQNNQYEINSRFGLASALFQPEDNTDDSLKVELTSIDEFVGFVRKVTKAYYDVPEKSCGVFMHYVKGMNDSTPLHPVLTLRVRQTNIFLTNWSSTSIHKYDLSSNNFVGPFGNVTKIDAGFGHTSCQPVKDDNGRLFIPCRNSSLADFFDLILSARITMVLRSVHVHPSSPTASVVRWSIAFDFEMSPHKSVITMTATLDPQQTQRAPMLPVVVCLILLPFCFWDLILRFRQFQRYRIYVTTYLPNWLIPNVAKHKRRFVREWEQKTQNFGTGWTIFAILSDVLVILFSMLSFADSFLYMSNSDLKEWKTLVLGLSVMSQSFLFISYLQHAPRFYVLTKAFATALPHLALYLVGVLPIFVGFALCGTVVFGGFTEVFSTLPYSMVTLFCAMMGDNLVPIFTRIDQTDYYPLRLFSRIYLSAFLVLFICNVLNVALNIVTDSYAHVQEIFEVYQYDQAKCDMKLGGNRVVLSPNVTSQDAANPAAAENNHSNNNNNNQAPLSKEEIRSMIRRIQGAIAFDEAQPKE